MMEMIRTEHTTEKYVIIAPRDGRLKYFSRAYNPKHGWKYSVKINDAMMFNTSDAARKAMEHFGIYGSIGKITKHLELVEVI